MANKLLQPQHKSDKTKYSVILINEDYEKLRQKAHDEMIPISSLIRKILHIAANAE